MPTLLHASISSVPAGAVTFLLSTVRFTRLGASAIPDQRLLCQYRQFLHRFAIKRTWTSFKVIFKFFSELLHNRDGWHCCRIAKRAECPAQHVLRKVLDVVDVLAHATTTMKPRKRLLQPVRPFAARNAPAATLVLVEHHDPLRVLDHARGVIQYDHAAG